MTNIRRDGIERSWNEIRLFYDAGDGDADHPSNHDRMSTTTEFLLVPLGFATLATLVFRLLGRQGLAALVIGWMAALSAYILGSVPDPGTPLHDFERTPVPALSQTYAGTLAAAAFVWVRKGKGSLPIRLLFTAAVYLAAAIPVGIAVLLVYMN